MPRNLRSNFNDILIRKFLENAARSNVFFFYGNEKTLGKKLAKVAKQFIDDKATDDRRANRAIFFLK